LIVVLVLALVTFSLVAFYIKREKEKTESVVIVPVVPGASLQKFESASRKSKQGRTWEKELTAEFEIGNWLLKVSQNVFLGIQFLVLASF